MAEECRYDDESADLVARIRAAASTQDDLAPYDCYPMSDILILAADEIERLRGDWKPIDTAPRDGTYVLLCDDRAAARDGNMEVGAWFGGADGCWWSCGGPDGGVEFNEGEPGRYGDFTHWMPLPAPPSINAKEPKA